MRKKFVSFFALCFSFLTIAVSCEQTFEPLQKNEELIFSMYGVVDLHGNFSVVRVMPIGERLLNTNPELNNSQVYLTHNSTGDRITFQDSLYQFGGDTYVWNYFLNNSLLANNSYRFVAEDADGRSSYVQINLPSELPFPAVEEYHTGVESGVFIGQSEDPIVSVKTRYLVQPTNELGCEPEMEIIISNLDRLTTRSDGSYRLEVNNGSEISSALGPSVENFRINRRELRVVSSGVDWPELSELIDLEITLPNEINNVENGVGYIAGVAGRIIQITPPQEPC